VQVRDIERVFENSAESDHCNDTPDNTTNTSFQRLIGADFRHDLSLSDGDTCEKGKCIRCAGSDENKPYIQMARLYLPGERNEGKQEEKENRNGIYIMPSNVADTSLIPYFPSENIMKQKSDTSRTKAKTAAARRALLPLTTAAEGSIPDTAIYRSGTHEAKLTTSTGLNPPFSSALLNSRTARVASKQTVKPMATSPRHITAISSRIAAIALMTLVFILITLQNVCFCSDNHLWPGTDVLLKNQATIYPNTKIPNMMTAIAENYSVCILRSV